MQPGCTPLSCRWSNRSSVPTQNGQELSFESNFNHAILLRTPRLDVPIRVTFQPPLLSLLMTAIGVVIANWSGLPQVFDRDGQGRRGLQ
jgi:hypothetical protein